MSSPMDKYLEKVPNKIVTGGVLGGLAIGCGVFLTATSGWLIVKASFQPVILSLLTAVVGVRAFGIGRPVFRYFERIVSHDAALDDLKNRRVETYDALIPLTPARLGRRRRADLLTGVVRDLDDEVDLQVRTVVPFIAIVVATCAALFVGFLIDLRAGTVLLGFTAAAMAIGALDLAMERRGQREVLEARAETQRAAHLMAADASAVRAIGAQDALLEQVERAQAGLARAARRQALGRAVGTGLSLVATGVATYAAASLLWQPVKDGEVNAAVAAVLIFMPLGLGDVLGLIPDAVGALARGRAAQRRRAALLDQEPAVTCHAASDGGVDGGVPRLTLDGASAGWTDDALHLQPTDLVVEPGEHVTVVGRNGVGKSTLLAVLARHVDLASGAYLIDGRDARALALDEVRSLFAIVDDEPHVFVGSVRANLLLARPDASDDDLTDALVRAGLGRWLAGLPDGLDTDLGTGARGISGGERARFAIARALLSQRPVVLLDEPVAHLDTPTAREVLDDLHAATRGRTVVLIAHQSIGTRGADRVVELSDRRDPALTPGWTR